MIRRTILLFLVLLFASSYKFAAYGTCDSSCAWPPPGCLHVIVSDSDQYSPPGDSPSPDGEYTCYYNQSEGAWISEGGALGIPHKNVARVSISRNPDTGVCTSSVQVGDSIYGALPLDTFSGSGGGSVTGGSVQGSDVWTRGWRRGSASWFSEDCVQGEGTITGPTLKELTFGREDCCPFVGEHTLDFTFTFSAEKLSPPEADCPITYCPMIASCTSTGGVPIEVKTVPEQGATATITFHVTIKNAPCTILEGELKFEITGKAYVCDKEVVETFVFTIPLKPDCTQCCDPFKGCSDVACPKVAGSVGN